MERAAGPVAAAFFALGAGEVTGVEEMPGRAGAPALTDGVATDGTDGVVTGPPNADPGVAVALRTELAIVSALPKLKPAWPSAAFMVAVDCASAGSACAFRLAAWPSKVASGAPAPLRASARIG